VRTVLSRYCDVPPMDWRFVRDAYGRPHVAAPHPPGLPAFNLSHTRGLVVCAVTGAPEVGVDVEHVRERSTSLSIADRYFAPAEAAALRALPPELQRERFFHYWTLKEAYIKARGKGLSIPLGDFAFELVGERGLRMRVAEPLKDDPARWRYWLCQPSPEHVAALCIRAEPGTTGTLTMTRVVPLCSEKPFACEVLRA
jgi:4'-phosphopantetheinyl transferase